MKKENLKNYKAPSKIDDKKAQHCYYCGEAFETINEIVITKIPLSIQYEDKETGKERSTVKQMNRKFHFECLGKYRETMNDEEERRIENSDWDMLYQYVKKEILQQPSHVALSKYCVERLLGLRLGKFIPRGENVRGLNRGFEFKLILTTFKICRNRIRQAFRDTIHIVDNRHRVNLMMKIVTNQIWEIQYKMDKMKEQEILNIAQQAKSEQEDKIKQEIGYTSYSDELKKEREAQLEKEREERRNRLEETKKQESLEQLMSKDDDDYSDDKFNDDIAELMKEFGM